MLHRHALMCLTFIHHLMVKTHRHFNNIQPSEAPAHAETQAYSLTYFLVSGNTRVKANTSYLYLYHVLGQVLAHVLQTGLKKAI